MYWNIEKPLERLVPRRLKNVQRLASHRMPSCLCFLCVPGEVCSCFLEPSPAFKAHKTSCSDFPFHVCKVCNTKV